MSTPFVPFAQSPSYGVSRDGQVKRLDSGRIKTQIRAQRGGYRVVSLWENGKERIWPVHQIVAITFHGPRPSPKHDAAHTDGNKDNNHYTNIRWATRAENEADKVRHGTSNRGERNGRAKLTNAQVFQVRQAAAAGIKQIVIALQYGIDQSQVSNIVRGKHRIEVSP